MSSCARSCARAGTGPCGSCFRSRPVPRTCVWPSALVAEAQAELRGEGAEFGEDLPLGLNIEVPSAALTADLLARDVEFFSIGTNDLIQYLLAVDRADPRVAPSTSLFTPAVVRTIAHVVGAAQARDLPVSVCGEMAASPLHALLLVGLGVRELSMGNPAPRGCHGWSDAEGGATRGRSSDRREGGPTAGAAVESSACCSERRPRSSPSPAVSSRPAWPPPTRPGRARGAPPAHRTPPPTPQAGAVSIA